MIGNIQLKVCGLTSLDGVEAARRAGADYLGFNLYAKSPRYVGVTGFKAMAGRLPAGLRRVAVAVEPSVPEVAAMLAAGFDFIQIHFRAETPLTTVAGWSATTGPDRLWLVPKLPPGTDVAAEWLPLAQTFLVDTFDPNAFGGTGRTGDWSKFARYQTTHPEKTWVLAGGLSPDNISEALRQSRATFLDVNSGVETTPGVKDHAKLQLLQARVRESQGA